MSLAGTFHASEESERLRELQLGSLRKAAFFLEDFLKSRASKGSRERGVHVSFLLNYLPDNPKLCFNNSMTFT